MEMPMAPMQMPGKPFMMDPNQRGGSSCSLGGGLGTALAVFGIFTEIAAIAALISLSIFLIRRSRSR